MKYLCEGGPRWALWLAEVKLTQALPIISPTHFTAKMMINEADVYWDFTLQIVAQTASDFSSPWLHVSDQRTQATQYQPSEQKWTETNPTPHTGSERQWSSILSVQLPSEIHLILLSPDFSLNVEINWDGKCTEG